MKHLGIILAIFSGFAQSALAAPTVSYETVINGPIYVVGNDTVESLSYPNAEFVNGPIYIEGNPGLTAVDFPNLLYVNGPIYITLNPSLEKATYPLLKFVNGPIYQYGNK